MKQHIKRGLICSVYAIIILGITPVMLYAQRTKSSLKAGEQRKAEKGLRDNRYFFYFINSSISNFGSHEEKDLFRKAIRHDILAQLLYMRFNFKESYHEIRTSQRILIDLYRITLDRDLGLTRKLLDRFAPRIIHSRDTRARSYLWLGYRNLKSARTNMIMGDNFYETLYSMRLYQYVKSIKRGKEGKRFALLSAIEVNTPFHEKTGVDRMSFTEISAKLEILPEKDKIQEYRHIHEDNYYRIINGTSLKDQVWENPRLRDMKEYNQYFMESDISGE